MPRKKVQALEICEHLNPNSMNMSVEELRKRLKHIAGLCYGLSLDLALLQEENERLLTDNQGLIALLAARDREIEKMRKAVVARQWYAKKKAEDPEKLKAQRKINNARAYQKRKLKDKEETP